MTESNRKATCTWAVGEGMTRRKEEVKIRRRSLLAVGTGRQPLWLEHRRKWEVSHEMSSEVSPEAGSAGTSQDEQRGAHPRAVGTRGRWDQLAVSQLRKALERERRGLEPEEREAEEEPIKGQEAGDTGGTPERAGCVSQ